MTAASPTPASVTGRAQHGEARAAIAEALSHLMEPGAVYELRLPKAGRHKTVSGYFDDPAALAKAAADWDGKAPGLYLTLNPVKPALLARCANRAQPYADTTTGDADTLRRLRLMVDCDPVRPSGIASTDAEHVAALERADSIRADLRGRGWPEPLLIDSGNGARLDYRIDLANDAGALALVKRALEALAFEFGDGVVGIDTAVCNAARIARIPGTLNAKGDDTPERPHRRAALLEVPAVLAPVSRELLEALADTVPKPEPRAKGATPRADFDLERWIAAHGLEVLREGPWSNGYRWILRRCPFNEEHGGSSAAILQHARGAAVFHCMHNGCAGRGWRELRELLEPEAARSRDGQRQVGQLADVPTQAEAEGGQKRAGPYSIESGALTWWKATRDGASPVRLGNFAARIVAEEIRDDGAEQTVQLRIEGTLASGRPLRAASIPAAQFGGMNWTLGAWGAAAIPTAGQGTKDHLRAAIQTLSGEIPQTVIYTCTGWRKIGARWAYLHAGGAIGADGPVDGVAVDLSGPLTGYVLPAPPEGAELAAAVRASLDLLDLGTDGVTVPLLAGVARSVIDGADFALHYSGATGVWKSELAALAQSHFGAGFSGRNLPGSWSSTENALEGLAFLAKDALLVVDDFAPRGSTQDIARMHKAAERLIRASGNVAARGRMRADLSLRPPKPPRGLIFSTGEDLPPGHSLRARMVIVEVRAGDIDGDWLTRAQEHARRGTFAAAMAGYICWLAPRLERERERRAGTVSTWRARGGAHRRTPDTLANLAAGIDAYLRFAAAMNAITDAERASLEQRVERALLALGEAQAEHLRSEEPTVRFLELLRAAITSGDAHLASARDESCPCDDGARAWGWDVASAGHGGNETRTARPHGRRIGWIREALGGWDVYLSPGPAYRVAQEYASRQGWAVATGERTLWRRLAEGGLLAASDEGRQTCKVQIGSRRERVLHLRPGALLSSGIGAIGAIGAAGPEDVGERSAGSPGADPRPDPRPDNDSERGEHRGGNGPEDEGERSREASAPFAPIAPILGGEREPVQEADPLTDVERF